MTKEKCPICGSEMETWHDVLDGWCLMEDYVGCPNHCYSYYYYTGATDITIGDKVFSWYHSNPPEYINKMKQEADEYLKIWKDKHGS